MRIPDPDKPGRTKKEYTGKRAVVEVGFHSLRHTFVSLQAESGTPQTVVQAIVGHGKRVRPVGLRSLPIPPGHRSIL